MIKSGWKVQYRQWGVRSLEEPYAASLTYDEAATSRRYSIRVDIEHQPAHPIVAVDIPRFVAAGFGPAPIVPRRPPSDLPQEAPSIWLTITASTLYPIDQELERRFFGDPEIHVRAVSDALRATVERELRPLAHLVAAVWAVRLPDQVLQLDVEQDCYWSDETTFHGISEGSLGESVGLTELPTASHLPRLMDAIAVRLPEAERRILARALHHYVKGRAELVGGIDRFLGSFMALEALANLAPSSSSDPEYLRSADALTEAVATATQDVIDFVKRLLDRQPSANTRFTALCQYLSSPTPEEDRRLFRDLNSLRGDFAHGRIEDPSDADEVRLCREADQLAVRYIGMALDKFRTESVEQGKIMLGDPDR